MGYYYYFANRTTNQSNQHPIYGQVTWIAKLHQYPDEEIQRFFELVIEKNQWALSDEIVAIPVDPEYITLRYRGGQLDEC